LKAKWPGTSIGKHVGNNAGRSGRVRNAMQLGRSTRTALEETKQCEFFSIDNGDIEKTKGVDPREIMAAIDDSRRSWWYRDATLQREG